jgi:hypothetical protein
MPVTVKNISLWRAEVENRPGALAQTLEPLSAAGANLQVLMGYGYPGNETKAAIEVYPVANKKQASAAQKAGLTASAIPTLLVEGDNKPGLGHAIAAALAGAGINLHFLVAQVIGRRYAAILGFGSQADAKQAGSLIKKAAAPGPRKRR